MKSINQILFLLISISYGSLSLSAQCSDIYFYRMSGFLQSDNPLLLIQDGKQLATVKVGDRYKATVCSSGEYQFVVKTNWDALVQNTETIQIDYGKEYYLKISLATGVEIPKISLKKLKDGKKDMGKGGKFKGEQRAIKVKENPITITSSENGGGETDKSIKASAQNFQQIHTAQNFKFEIVNISKAGDMLKFDYKITNLANDDRFLGTHGNGIYFYDDVGNFYTANEVCIMNNCYNNYRSLKDLTDYTRRGQVYIHGSHIMPVIPYGIPVNASIVIRNIKNDASKFVRGEMLFRAADRDKPRENYIDFKIPYFDIVFPKVVDSNNPNKRNIGTQSIELIQISKEVNTTFIQLKASNNNSDPFDLKIQSGVAYDDLGNQYDINAVSFISKNNRKEVTRYSRELNKEISGGSEIDFYVIIDNIDPKAKELRRLKIQFAEFELSWENLLLSKNEKNSTPVRTTGVSSSETFSNSSYIQYTDFKKKVRNKEKLIGVKVILENIYFATGSDRLLESSHPHLDELANLMNHNQNLKVEISGHTDDVGDDISNLVLSQKRADAIKYHLIGKSIHPTRIISIGKGEQEFMVSNVTEASRRKNRRVEVKVVE